MKLRIYFLLLLILCYTTSKGQLLINEINGQKIYVSDYDNLVVYDSGGEFDSYGSGENFTFEVCVYDCSFDNLPKIAATITDIDISSSFGSCGDMLTFSDIDGPDEEICNTSLPPGYDFYQFGGYTSQDGCMKVSWSSDGGDNGEGFAIGFEQQKVYEEKGLLEVGDDITDFIAPPFAPACYDCIDEYLCLGDETNSELFGLEHEYNVLLEETAISITVTGNVNVMVFQTGPTISYSCQELSWKCYQGPTTFLLEELGLFTIASIIIDSPSGDETYSISASNASSSCEFVMPLGCGESINSSTLELGNFFDIADYTPCYSSDNQFQASDKTFVIERESADQVQIISMTPEPGLNLDLFLLSSCLPAVEVSNCVPDETSTNFGSSTETIDLTGLAAGTYYVVVDGPDPSQVGNFAISLDCDGFTCENSRPAYCGFSEFSDNFSGSNSSETYTGCNQQSVSMTGNEVIYEITPNETGDYTFLLISFNGMTDLDMFLLDACDPNFCLKKTDMANAQFQESMTQTLFAGNTYYVVIDGDSNNGATPIVNGNYYFGVNCSLNCTPKSPLRCGVTENFDNYPAEFQSSRVSHYICGPSNEAEIFYSAPEVAYEFVAPTTGDYTFDLQTLDNSQDLDLFFLSTCDWSTCFENTNLGFDPGQPDNAVLSMSAGESICVVVDGEGESASEYELTVTGCTTDYCDIVTPTNISENYVEFDDSGLPNPASSYTVTFPLGATGSDITYEETLFTEGGELPGFYCPQPGCYFICFFYLNDQGGTELCCIKYCASFKYDDCFSPVVYDYNENLEDETFTCRLSCEPIATKGMITGDSSYIRIISEVVDTIIDEDAICPTLPFGEYEICCYVYDEECDFWSVCCDIYCFPFITDEMTCIEPPFIKSNENNTYIGASAQPLPPAEDVFTITPDDGGLTIQIVPDPPPSFVQTYVLTVNSPGIYRVCDGECCQYICWDGEPEPEDCIDIQYINGSQIQLSCPADEYVYSWRIDALCIPPDSFILVTCEFWNLYGSNPIWTVPEYGGEFQICKNYNGCCGEVEQCCETICLGNDFVPYNEDGEFDHCDDVFVNYLGQENDDGAFGRFLYTGDNLGAEGARWEVWTDIDTGPTAPFGLLATGPSDPIFDTRDIGITFLPNARYYICYSYIGDGGCREYCCIKVDFPSNCDHDTNYSGSDGDLTFTYNTNLETDEEIVFWTVSDDDNFYGSPNPFTYTYIENGMYYVCCLRWNNELKCYSLCCTKYCIQDPLACGESDGIVFTWDSSDLSYDLTLSVGGSVDDMWQIDVPIALLGTEITDPANFRPADFGIAPNEQIVVSVKYRDNDDCIEICCKELCSSGPDNCEETCYENCCAGVDLQWLEDVKANLYQTECSIFPDCPISIAQGMLGDTCVYILPTICSISDQPFVVVGCQGDTIFAVSYQTGFNVDRFESITDVSEIWSCAEGNEPQCHEPPCDFENQIFCESFQGYSNGDLVADQDNWSLAGNVLSPNILTEAAGNLVMNISPGPLSQGAQLELNDTSLPAATLTLSYTVSISPTSGHLLEMNRSSNENILLELLDADGDGRLDIKIQVSDRLFTEYTPVNITYSEYTYLQFHLNKGTQELSVYIDEQLTFVVPNCGVLSFANFYTDNQLGESGDVLIDDICLSTCETCSEEFTYDPVTFEDCEGIAFAGFVPEGDGALLHSFSYEGDEDILGVSAYELNTVTDELTLVSSEFTFACELGKTYIICVYYLDENGCRVYCCRKVKFEAECNNIIPIFTGTVDDIRYQFEYTFLGDEETVTEWVYYADGESIPLAGNMTTEELSLNGVTELTICCYVYDAFFKCYRLCCRRICISNPLNECDVVSIDRNTDGTYLLSAGTGVQVLRWDIDLPSQYAGPIGSDNPQIFNPADFNIPLDEEIIISVKYIDGDGCIKVCCTSLCLNPLEINCDEFTVTASSDGPGWIFDIDDMTGFTGFSTVITLPDGSEDELSGTLNSYPTTEEGNYRICRYYTNECDQATECCKEICLTQPVICEPLTFTIVEDTVFTFMHTIENGSSYEWDFGDGNTSNDPANGVTHTYGSETASYTVTLTVTDACGIACTSSIDISIGNFQVTATTTDLSCLGEADGSISLTISGGEQPYTIDWLDGPDGQLLWSDLLVGNYSVQVSEAGGKDTTIMVMLLAPEQPIFQTDVTPTSCGLEDGAVSVSITNDVDVTLFRFLDGSNAVSENETGLFAGVKAGSGLLSVFYGDGCMITVEIDILESEDFLLDIDDTEFTCVDSGLLQTGLSSDLNFTWSLDGSVISGAAGPSIMVGESGNYKVVADNGTCIKEDSAIVTITAPSVYTVQSTNTTCGAEDGTISITATNGIDIASIKILNSGDIIQGSELTGLAAGDYNLEITDVNGCVSIEFERIESSEDFTFSLGEDMIVCPEEVVTIFSGLDPTLYAYTWSLNGNILDDESADLLITAPGTYQLAAVNAAGCEVSRSIFVAYYPQLTSVDGDEGSFEIGDPLTYEVIGAESVTWTSVNIPLSCTDCKEIVTMATESGTVTLQATDINGCQTTETFIIDVDSELIFPNYITPNGDNMNDVLEITGSDQLTMTSLVVFNKWGQTVFESGSYNNNWGGTTNTGEVLPDGAYYYALSYSIGELQFKKVHDLTILKNQ